MKIVSVCIAILIAAAVTGCVRWRAQDWKAANDIDQECRDKKRQGTIPTWVEAMRCGNDRMRLVYQRRNQYNMTKMEVFLAARVVAGERMDAGTLTEAGADLALALLLANLDQQANVEAVNASRAYSEQLMGLGAAMQGMGTLNQSLNPPPPPMLIVPRR